MKDVFKHLVTLAWFTAVFGVMFMIAFNYAKSAVEDTKVQVMESVNSATETITAPITSFQSGVTSIYEGVGEFGNALGESIEDLDRRLVEMTGQEAVDATYEILDAPADTYNWPEWLRDFAGNLVEEDYEFKKEHDLLLW